MRRRWVVALLTALALGIPPTAAAGARLPPIGLAIAGQIVGAADAIAIRQGYFTQEGLDVRPRPAALPGDGAALASEAVDINTMAARPFLLRLDKTPPYVAVASAGLACGATHVVVRKGSDIRGVAQLKGKTIGLPRGGTLEQVFVGQIAPAHGLTPGDYTVTVIADARARVPSLVVKLVDAAIAAEPAVAAAEQEGTARSLESFCKYDPLPYVVVASARLVKAHPDAVIGYLRGRLRAIALLREDPARAAAAYAEELKVAGQDIPVAAVEHALRRVNWEPAITPDLERYLAARLKAMQAVAGDARPKTVPDLSPAIDRDLLQKAMRPK